MATMFEFLDSINTGKVLELDEDNPYKDYVPFQINNGLSQYMDTVMLANEMNKRPWLTKELQFRFLTNVVSKKKRFGKWGKAEEVANQADIDLVSEYYNINKDKAVEYLRVLGQSELEAIRKKSDKGGASGKMPKPGAKKVK